MLDTLDVNFHGKRHTDFDLKRIIRAQEQGFDIPVTAYLAEYPSGRAQALVLFLATSAKTSTGGLAMAT